MRRPRYNFAAAKLLGLTISVFDHFHRDVPTDFALATQSLGVFGDPHVLLAVVARAQVLHAFLHAAHARGAEAVAAARMLHGNPRVERDREDRLPLWGVDLGYSSVCLYEADFGHGTRV